LKEGDKHDRIDARKLAELLRSNQVKPVYHGNQVLRARRSRLVLLEQSLSTTPKAMREVFGMLRCSKS